MDGWMDGWMDGLLCSPKNEHPNLGMYICPIGIKSFQNQNKNHVFNVEFISDQIFFNIYLKHITHTSLI
jgi:hypothetical protein